MKTLAVIVIKNQNEINPKEKEKIRRAVKKEFQNFKIKMIVNEHWSDAEEIADECDHHLTFRTYDVNCHIWAVYQREESTLIFDGEDHSETIALN